MNSATGYKYKGMVFKNNGTDTNDNVVFNGIYKARIYGIYGLPLEQNLTVPFYPFNRPFR
jgi:hypothetical protein